MADNYLENKYEAYLQRKAAAEKAKRLAWKKRMDAYKKKLAEEELMNTIDDFKAVSVVVFDADDTLWDNQSYYEDAEKKFCELMSGYGDAKYVSEELYRTESENMCILGYGAKAFTISLMETALRLGGDTLPASVQSSIVGIGKSLLMIPATPLDGVRDTLEKLRESGRYRLALLTKGDPLDQENKLKRSGLADMFEYVSIVADKTVKEYNDLCSDLNITPGRMAMVGNSFKSDIRPVLEIGGYGIHIPFHVTWLHEKVEEFDHHRLMRLKEISELTCLL